MSRQSQCQKVGKESKVIESKQSKQLIKRRKQKVKNWRLNEKTTYVELQGNTSKIMKKKGLEFQRLGKEQLYLRHTYTKGHC